MSPPLRECFRHPDEEGIVELRAFTHGLQPTTVPSMMEKFTEDWRRFGVDAWNRVPNHWRPESGDAVGWWTLPAYLGDEFVAPLLGAPPGTCIWQPNVHWTIQCLLSAPEVRRRGEVVALFETAFPSILHSVKRWADLDHWTPEIIPARTNDGLDPTGLLDAIGPETAVVALSHVGFTTGARVSDAQLQRVAKRAHEHDALLLIDGYHAAGSIPIDVSALECDLYVGGLLKEACGSSGNAFVFVREGLEISPRLTGWFGDAAPFAFRPEPEPHPDVRRRFLGGTTPVAPMYHAVEGVRILLDCGLEAVRDHSLALTKQALKRADTADLPVRSPRPPEARGAMVLLQVPAARAMTEYLKSFGIYTDSRRNEVVRMAPFVWNTLNDVNRAFDQIEKGLKSDAYKDHAPPNGPVT